MQSVPGGRAAASVRRSVRNAPATFHRRNALLARRRLLSRSTGADVVRRRDWGLPVVREAAMTRPTWRKDSSRTRRDASFMQKRPFGPECRRWRRCSAWRCGSPSCRGAGGVNADGLPARRFAGLRPLHATCVPRTAAVLRTAAAAARSAPGCPPATQPAAAPGSTRTSSCTARGRTGRIQAGGTTWHRPSSASVSRRRRSFCPRRRNWGFDWTDR